MGTDDKLHFIEEVGDVVVVPETKRSPSLGGRADVQFRWKGANPRKGLGVFAFRGYSLEPMDAPAELGWVLPLRVIDPDGAHCFNLLAVWTVVGAGRPTYDGQVKDMVRAWTPLLRSGSWVIAGDLNALPRQVRHAHNLTNLTALGMRSAYHELSKCPHGEEPVGTLRWRGKDFHPDFVFLSQDLMKRASSARVGAMSAWVESGRSDHCPVTVTLGQ